MRRKHEKSQTKQVPACKHETVSSFIPSCRIPDCTVMSLSSEQQLCRLFRLFIYCNIGGCFFLYSRLGDRFSAFDRPLAFDNRFLFRGCRFFAAGTPFPWSDRVRIFPQTAFSRSGLLFHGIPLCAHFQVAMPVVNPCHAGTDEKGLKTVLIVDCDNADSRAVRIDVDDLNVDRFSPDQFSGRVFCLGTAGLGQPGRSDAVKLNVVNLARFMTDFKGIAIDDLIDNPLPRQCKRNLKNQYTKEKERSHKKARFRGSKTKINQRSYF